MRGGGGCRSGIATLSPLLLLSFCVSYYSFPLLFHEVIILQNSLFPPFACGFWYSTVQWKGSLPPSKGINEGKKNSQKGTERKKKTAWQIFPGFAKKRLSVEGEKERISSSPFLRTNAKLLRAFFSSSPGPSSSFCFVKKLMVPFRRRRQTSLTKAKKRREKTHVIKAQLSQLTDGQTKAKGCLLLFS